jgi:hypothetical protein
MPNVSDAVRTLDSELRELFGNRVKSIVTYASIRGSGAPVSTLAIVDGLTAEDLRRCASRVAGWHDTGLATPLLVAEQEFERSLDAFPLEFGAILADHQLVSGTDPFAGLRVNPEDLRRACEVQARSHLLHLREGYVETRGRSDAIADLITRSAGSLASLVKSVARLQGAPSADVERAARHVEDASGLAHGTLAGVATLTSSGTLSSDRAREIFPAYLEAVRQLTNYIDRWTVDDR